MSCNNCAGTVWFDHGAKAWKHGQPLIEGCKKPEPKVVKNG